MTARFFLGPWIVAAAAWLAVGAPRSAADEWGQPTNTAGSMRRPRNSTAALAMPADANIGLAWPVGRASSFDSTPAIA